MGLPRIVFRARSIAPPAPISTVPGRVPSASERGTDREGHGMRLEIPRTLAPPRAPHRQYLPIPDPGPEPGLYRGEPAQCRRSVRRFLPVMLHLGLLLTLFFVYHVEGRAFRLVASIATAALPVHYLLPFRLKKPFFVAASITALGFFLGIAAAALVVAVGLGLIALSRLDRPWVARVAVVAGVGVLLALARAFAASLPLPEAAWPMLGSMFMFRMILYLYELKHAEGPESFGDALAYFFLLPNFCFFHFPVVDYRNFRRGYFARDVHAVQVDGLKMMTRGAVHLLLFRLVYHDLLIAQADVHDPLSLLRFVVANYLQYLQVSGQFHMACGMLHLFGFALPETHHHYLLATSFTDYWRRINIYWKDFMVRVVFNPVVFRMKRHRQPVALAAATATVFLVTWLLHAYQMFWRWGTFGFSVPDALFWGILGGFVLVNVQLDARAPRRGRLKGPDLTLQAVAARSAKTLATFATIALLWSLWYSPSLGAWLDMLRRAAG